MNTASQHYEAPNGTRYKHVMSGTAELNRMQYMAQSVLWGLISWPELPSVEEAIDILAWANRTPTK